MFTTRAHPSQSAYLVSWISHVLLTCMLRPWQVRLLGEYHRGFQASEDPDGQDIGDPLYGNANGPNEKARVAARSRAPIAPTR